MVSPANVNEHKYRLPVELALNSPANDSRVTVSFCSVRMCPAPAVGLAASTAWARIRSGRGVLRAKQGDVDGSVGDWNTQTTVDKHGT